MLATTLLLYFAARRVWKWSRIQAGALCAIPLVVEGAFFTGNSLKVLHGGWLPLAIGAVVFLQMTTWKKGRYLLRKNSRQMLSLTDLIISTTALAESGLPCRVPGTAVFLSAQPKGAPTSLLHNIRHNRVLHQRNIVLTIVTYRRIPCPEARALKLKISLTVFRIIAHFGFMETPTIGDVHNPALLATL
jgi:KUP system potassium uptake protein